MLSQEEHERLTRVGPGTPMGELMRRYWIPAVFSRQIEKPNSPPVRVRRLLLDTLKDMEAGRPLPGRDGAHYRARALRLEAPSTTPFAELVEAQIWGNQSAAGE